MTDLKKGTPEPEPTDQGLLDIYNIEEYQVKDPIKESIDNKEELTEREQKFIMFHILNHIPAKYVLILSGYSAYNEKHAYAIARKILKKYDLCTEGA